MPGPMQDHLTKHQHFVPKSYLKHWCDEKDQLYVYKIAAEKDFKANKRNVAGRKFAYDTQLTLDPNHPERLQYFERQFSEIETSGERLFAAIHERVRKLDSPIVLPPSYSAIPKDEISHLIRFMVIQILRGMQTREQMTNQWNEWCKKIWEETAPILFPNEEIELQFDQVSEDWIKHSQMEFMATRVEKYSALIEEKIAVFGFVRGTTKLYTSDNPVHWTGYMIHPTVKWDGILSPTSRMVYPLAPDVCAIFYDRDFYVDQLQYENSARLLSPDEIEAFNHHLVLQSHSEIYSCDGDFSAAKFTLSQKKISGEKWHGSDDGNERFNELLQLLKDAAKKVPKGYYSKERWLSIIRQEGNLPFGKM